MNTQTTPETASAFSPLELTAQLRRLRASAALLRGLPREIKDRALMTAAHLLHERSAEILRANAQDLQALDVDAVRAAQAKGNGSEVAVRGFASKATPAFRDRLLLNETRLAAMSESLRQVAALPDPVGEEVDARTLENGLLLRRVRSPLGVILMIFESRPNVATEAFSLAFKSGNAIILRGGKESMRSTEALYAVLREALREAGAPEDALWGVTNPDRALVLELLKRNRAIDLVVPRGGDSLISFVEENSHIPIIKNDRGLCHVYVHHDADLGMAEQIVVNAKTQRPGVCNSMETLLVHRSVAATLLPALYEKMRPFNVRWNGCGATLKLLFGKQDVRAATSESWDTEWLDMIMNCRVVDSLDEALAHIDAHGSRHSEAIVTESEASARRFQSEVDAAAAYWNASTRFTDGFEFGLGGELGISTQKLHVRGPVGLRELTSPRWLVDGSGQTRG